MTGKTTLTPLERRIAEMEWISEDVAAFAGLTFFFEPAFGNPPPGHVYVFKPRRFLSLYAAALADSPTRNVLELGIWLGGSAIAWAALLDVEKLVALDISQPISTFDDLRRDHPLGDRISVYYETSQDDQAALKHILDTEFAEPPDLIIDDASHLYDLSRRSFEILFPRLRPGGWYVIEDWAWAHFMHDPWPEQPSLASLVFELQLAWIGRPDLIDRIVVEREMVFVRKGATAPVGGPLSLDEMYILKHRKMPVIA